MLMIYVPAFTARCQYVFELIFKDEYAIPYHVTTSLEIFEAHPHEKINYSFKKSNNEFHISASSLLFEQGIKKVDISVESKFGTTVLFLSEPACTIGFDIFAAVFYMVSRYEEYLPFTPDQYGRYTSLASLASQHKFLHQPVVNKWIHILKISLLKQFPDLKVKPSAFDYLVTYDIDIAYGFKGRNVFRTIGSTIKDVLQLKLKNVLERIKSLANLQQDPWDMYEMLSDLIIKNNLHSIFFFLMSDYTRYDKNLCYKHPLMKKLVTNVVTFSELGIHPSFQSSFIPKKIGIEKQRLENMAGKRITKSRQHFLKFTLPDTYNHLINAGIKEDYSMGFADIPGFRAGTCKPFYFYDLLKEKSTDLKIFPVTLMEGAFIDYLRTTPHEALDHILKLMEEVKKVQGTFISIWHNHTLSNTGIYTGWRSVHDKMIAQILLYDR